MGCCLDLLRPSRSRSYLKNKGGFIDTNEDDRGTYLFDIKSNPDNQLTTRQTKIPMLEIKSNEGKNDNKNVKKNQSNNDDV